MVPAWKAEAMGNTHTMVRFHYSPQNGRLTEWQCGGLENRCHPSRMRGFNSFIFRNNKEVNMKHWDNLIFSGETFQTKKGPAIIFNITDNKMSDCQINVNDIIVYKNIKYKVIDIERFVKTFNDINGNPLPGDNFAFLLEDLSKMEKECRDLVKKWDATGLLEGLKPGSDLDKMAKLLECEPIQKITKTE